MATAYFVDSSALVKRYVLETGSAWVRSITRRRSSTDIFIALITAVEVTSAIARRRGVTLSAAQASSCLSRFRKHLAGRYLPSQITPTLVTEAMTLANKHRLALTTPCSSPPPSTSTGIGPPTALARSSSSPPTATSTPLPPPKG